MFIPCDEEGNVLERPLHIEQYEGDTYDLDCEQFQEARKRVLFKGFEVIGEWIIHDKIGLLIMDVESVYDTNFFPIDELDYLTHLNLDINESAIKYYVK